MGNKVADPKADGNFSLNCKRGSMEVGMRTSSAPNLITLLPHLFDISAPPRKGVVKVVSSTRE